MGPAENEISTEEELLNQFNKNIYLLSPKAEYPGCDQFCIQAREFIMESLRRLNLLSRTDLFWDKTNKRLTFHKLRNYCLSVLKHNPQDVLSLWTMAALDVSGNVDWFGCEYWGRLHALGHFDTTWPICAALIQGGPAGITYRELAQFLLDVDAVEAARPRLQWYADSDSPNARYWATRVLGLLQKHSGA